jgi:phosphoribosylanthranilate isomerase
MTRTRIKICGICTPADAITVVQSGADAIGMVFYDRSPRHVSLDQAAEIAAVIPPFISTVCLFVNAERGDINEVISRVKPDLLQFHGDEDEEFCSSFDVAYIKALRVQDGSGLMQSCRDYSSAKGILLDSYTPGTPGGTGESFDWSGIPEQLPLPVILAGGLDSDNVARAISIARPWAVDVSSGVEEYPGKKDALKVSRFVQAVQSCSSI